MKTRPRSPRTQPGRILRSLPSSIKSGVGPSVIFSAIVALAGQTSLFAATYYVAKTGNNSSAGSQTAPWLTIQKAATIMVAGDNVVIGPGTYAECVSLTKSGSSTSKITFGTSGAVTVGGFNISGSWIVMSGFTLNGSNVPMNDGDIQLSGSNCSFSNFTLVGTPGTIVSSTGGVLMTGQPTNDSFTDFALRDVNYHNMTFYGSGHTISRWTVRATNGWDVFRPLCSNTVISDCDISVQNPGDANPNHCDIFQTFGDNRDVSKNVIIERNYVHGCQGYQLGNITDDQENGDISGWTFRNNIFANIDSTINLYAPGFSFYNNTFYKCAPISLWVIIIGSSTAGHANNLTIQNNIFYQCGDPARANCGWYVGDPVTGLVADYNLVVGSGSGAVKDSGWNASGRESHGINGTDPLFANSAAGDFHLKTGSPAIAKGLNLSSLFTSDYSVTLRSGAWDLGALQASTTSVVAPYGATTSISVP